MIIEGEQCRITECADIIGTIRDNDFSVQEQNGIRKKQTTTREQTRQTFG
jgi:hypothetical protein